MPQCLRQKVGGIDALSAAGTQRALTSGSAPTGMYVWKDLVYKDKEDGPLPARSMVAAADVSRHAVSSHPKHRLDVYMAADTFPRKPAPVLVFVHGGSWQEGDKQHPSVPHLHGNVGMAAARAGCIGVVISYRLARPVWEDGWSALPSLAAQAFTAGASAGIGSSNHAVGRSTHPAPPVAPGEVSEAGPLDILTALRQRAWELVAGDRQVGRQGSPDARTGAYAAGYEEQAEDVAAAVAWVGRHISVLGGDPCRVVLAGSSAGGHLAALVAGQRAWLEGAGFWEPGADRSLAGLVCLSGVFNIPRLAGTPVGPLVCAPAFGSGEGRWRAGSPTLACTGPDSPLHGTPTLLLNAEEDVHLEQDAEELEARLALGGLLRQQGGQAPAMPDTAWWGDLPPEVVVRPRVPGGELAAPQVTRAVVQGRGHLTSVMGVGVEGDATTAALSAFLQHVGRREPS